MPVLDGVRSAGRRVAPTMSAGPTRGAPVMSLLRAALGCGCLGSVPFRYVCSMCVALSGRSWLDRHHYIAAGD
jgi:hypothetical protein